jgi:hypothetical protein
LTIFTEKIYFIKCSILSQLKNSEYNVSVELLTGYKVNLKPSYPSINIDLTLNQIININEKNQIMTTSVLLNINWKDDRLDWDLNVYNLTDILIPANSIWTPDLFVINTADSNGYVNIPSQSLALVNYDGEVNLILSISTLNTRCDMNIYKFPFDSQSCPIQIGTWQNDLTRLTFTDINNTFNLDSYITNPIWQLNSINVSNIESTIRFYSGLNGIDIKYLLNIKRMPNIYILYYVFPCFILNAVILITFFVPFAQQTQISN